ncbi:Glutathione S-transferase [hydrothermal vent metagenome]|uniref:Glutathione S-transferase n=1 Tax=hydrothermal vent metagenome TaxID=652676 RepID=A0A3B0W120_9ZZZZ
MSGLTLIIGNKNYSSWSLRPWIFLKYHQLEFNEIRVPLFTETTNEELSEYNSDFKVPILKDGELVVWDSLSILEYISEKYLGNKGWPSNIKSRSVARSVSSEMHSSFFNIRNELPMNCRKKFNNIELSKDAECEVERIKYLWRMCQNNYGNKGGWLFGDFSIVDAMFAPIALRLDGYSIPVDNETQKYIKQVLDHPYIIEWVEAGKIEKEIIGEDEVEI